MKKQFLSLLITLVSAFSSFAIAPIVGPHTICRVGGASTPMSLTDASVGGTWTSSNPAIVSVVDTGTSGGGAWVNVDGLALGTATVTYTVGGTFVTQDVTVGNFTGSLVSGSTHLCIGDTTTLVNSISGGTWISDNAPVADAYGFSGIVTAYADGVANIYYHCNGLCSISYPVTVGIGTDNIAGSSIICIGSTTPYTDPISGGVWSSSDPSIAGISSGGLITGMASGTATISYHLTGTCGGTDATKVIAITGAVTPDTIGYTTTTVNVGSIINLTDATPGGTWTSSDPAIAYINAATGALTGVSPGYATITYSVCGSVGTTLSIHVTSLDGISGHVNFSTGTYYGYVTVWLIKFDTATNMLTAVDSVVSMLGGASSLYYQFTGLPTDSFRIKAAYNSTSTTSYYGFMPTYYSSSFYWNTANVIHHVSGTSDVNKDINMIMGIVTAGAGFIAGDVTTGANRGSSTGSPAVGMAVYLLNSSNQIMQMTHTDAAGHYTFTGLPIGRTYTVFPEALGYGTTAYSSITLNSAATYMSAANFIQHTLSKTITPITEGVSNIGSTENTVIAYPNPTNGELNIAWNADASERGTLIISDISGRELLNNTLIIRQGSGTEQIDLSGFSSGIYFLSLRSGQINYNTKLQVVH